MNEETPQEPSVEERVETVSKELVNDTSSNPKKNIFKKLGKKKLLILATVAVVVLGGGGAAAFVLTKKDKPAPKSTQEATDTPAIVKQEPAADTAAKPVDLVTVSGSTVYATPKKLGDLKFFTDFKFFGGQTCDDSGKCTDIAAAKDISYYDVGTLKDGKHILVAHVKPPTIDVYDYIAIESAANTYQILSQHSDGATASSEFADSLASNVTIDKATVLTDLQFPLEATVAGQKLKTQHKNGYFMPNGLKSIRGSYFGEIASGETTEKIGTFGNFTLYRVTHKTTDTYKIIELYGTLGTSFAVSYGSNGELASTTDKLPITWSSGEQSTISAYSGGAGCGSIGYVVAQGVNASTLVQVGASKAGQKIYQLPSDAPLVNELFNDDYNKGADDEAQFQNLTLQQFLDKHAYFIVQNGLNEYVVFQRSDMFMRGGCGKPVIYLYPQTATDVSVKVGADVLVSAPHYETNGWQHVFAEPGGQLTYRGASYDSLFWEGYGHGVYPDITSGTIVRSTDAVATIQAQLAAQGFNAKETADFLAYWQPKLPATPYVRLTWFGTAAMNQLAPLSISPQPQTVIRTFLDFEGMQNPITLPAQKFSMPKRQGFTVTEWGGLLREGIKN